MLFCQSEGKIVCLRARVDQEGDAQVSRQGGGQPLCIVGQVVVEEPAIPIAINSFNNFKSFEELVRLSWRSLPRRIGFLIKETFGHLEFVFSWAIWSCPALTTIWVNDYLVPFLFILSLTG